MKRFRHHLYILLLFVFPTALFSQSEQVIVTVAKADIYAEPSTYSYKIDTVNRGTLLNLFQKTKVSDSWYYVRFQSRRYGGPAMGFIRDTDVELYAGETKEAEKPVPEKKPPEPERKAEEKTPPVKKTVTPPPEEKPAPVEKAEVKPAPITTEEVSVETQAPSYRSVQATSPQSSLEGRVYETVKPPPPAPTPHPKEAIRRPAAKTPEETPFVERTRPVQPPSDAGPVLTTTAFSDSVSLGKGLDSFAVNLDFAPFASFRSFEIPNPVRMVVDFQDVEESAGFHHYTVNDMGITAIRVAMYQDNIARVVFDFRREIPAYQIEQTEEGIKILFWLAETAQPPAAEPETQPVQPPAQKIEPEPEPAISTVVILRATPSPISSRFSLSEPISPPRPRLFLWLEQGTVETTVPRHTIANLPTYYPPTQEAYWEVVRTEPVKARPQAERLVMPAAQAELETAKQKQAPKPKPEQIDPPAQAPYYTQPQAKLPARLSLGLGYGSSTGGFGGFVQYSLSPNLALHGGAGYYPTALIYSETDWVENQVLYSFGLKYYIPIVSQSVRGYLNVQYGGFAVEAVQIIEGIYDYEFIYRNEQKTLFGPQALLGGEFHLGPLKLNAAAGAAYALTDWEWLPQDFYFTFDLGFMFSLK